jgi:hypothetical protein
MVDRLQKITFAEMRASGVRGILIYCADHKCSHSIAASRISGLTLPGFPISSRGMSARHVASAVPM